MNLYRARQRERKKTGKKKFKGLKLDNTFVSYFPFALNLKVRFKEIAGLF